MTVVIDITTPNTEAPEETCRVPFPDFEFVFPVAPDGGEMAPFEGAAEDWPRALSGPEVGDVFVGGAIETAWAADGYMELLFGTDEARARHDDKPRLPPEAPTSELAGDTPNPAGPENDGDVIAPVSSGTAVRQPLIDTDIGWSGGAVGSDPADANSPPL